MIEAVADKGSMSRGSSNKDASRIANGREDRLLNLPHS